MSLIKNEKLEGSRVELHFSIAQADYEAAVERVYRREVKKMNIPGFRKGKAPRSVVEKMYGKGVFFEDAINELIPVAYPAALAEAGINPVSQPEFDVVSMEGDVVLSAKVYVKPELAIKGYKRLKAVRKIAPVTDEEIDREIKLVQERNSRTIDVTDRAAENGDTAVIDYEGFCDGVAFEGGKGEDYALTLGSNTFIPGFEDQIVGHNIDDSFDVNVTFPEEYHSADLAGKAAVFKVTIHAITKTELPELDDEFAKDVSEFDTFAEYKADLTASIQKRHETAAENEMKDELAKKISDKLDADIPAAMFENETENMLRDYDNRLRQNGLDLSTYCKYTGMTLESLREQMRPQAEQQVKVRLALEAIAAAEGIEATEEDVNGEYQYIADTYHVDIEEVKKSIDAKDIAEDVKVKKAMDFVVSKAQIVDAAPEEAKTEASEETKDAE
jgi:trigger factor